MDSDNERIHFQAPNADVLSQMLLAYNVESLIAQGGMGAVYLAEQTALERKVAIKILPDEFGEDAGFREAFQAEARSMARINHPNLIAVFDFGDIDGMLYIIMEYAEGSSLFHLAEQEDLDHLFVAKVVSQIASGLSAAHDAGILHRDIKPSNILLNGKREAKISDFGLARPHANTESGIIYGTPGYTAPEVIKNPDAVDIRADIFSVGVILYELLAKTLPSKAYMPVNSLCGAKSDFDNIIRKAIHPSPKMRYSTAKALSEDLDDLARSIEKEQEPKTKTKTKFNTGAQALKATPANKLLNTGAQALKARPANKLLNTGAQALKATASNKLLSTGAQALKATASNRLKAPSPQLSRPAKASRAKAPAPSHLKPSLATGAQLITAAKHDTAATPTLQKPENSAEEDASTPVPVATLPSDLAIKPKNPNKALALNLVIIVVLSVACLFAWQLVKEKNNLAEQSRLDRRIANAIPNSEKPPTTVGQTTKIDNNGGGTSHPTPRNSIDVALGDGVNDTTNRETISLAEKERTSHEKALKQLHSEKLNLLNGIINPIKLPNNTITRGEHFYLYINQPMSWHEADAFCNEFGGQLANCPTPADAEFLRKAAKEDAPFWLGAGSDPGRNMSTVDGRQFTLNIDRVNLGKAVFYQTFTRAAMKHPIEKMTFFMQWNVKGDIPSTVNARLSRLFPSLGHLNPKFPPLTIGSGSRYYCVIYRPLTFEKARELARFAGGHLAVISNEGEQQMIAKQLKNSLPENTKLWVGLIKHKNGNWINDSIETDVKALWVDDQGKDEEFAALTYNQGSLQHVGAGVDKRGKLNATLIEWSQDEYEAYRSLFILDKMNDINSLRDRVRYIIFLEKAYHDYRLQLCPKRLAWAIRTWKNGSERDDRQRFDQSLTGKIKQLEQGTSITSSFKASSLPSGLEKMVEACLEAQSDLEKSHLKQNKTIRDGYLYALKRLLKEEPRKDSPRSKELQAEILKHKSSPSTFINMMKNQ